MVEPITMESLRRQWLKALARNDAAYLIQRGKGILDAECRRLRQEGKLIRNKDGTYSEP